MVQGRALIQPTTVNESEREVSVVFATENPVRRFGWGEDYDEVLVCDPSAVRTERIDRGLPVMDCHNTLSVFSQIGRTTKVWFENKELWATIKFSERAEVAELFKDVVSGIVKDISVGYVVYEFEVTKTEGSEIPTYRAVDWMPTEVSFAPVQADVQSGVRSNNFKNNYMSKKREMVSTIKYTVETAIVNKGEIIEIDGVKYVALDDGDMGEVIDLGLLECETEETTTEETTDTTTTTEETNATEEETEERSRMAAITSAVRAAGLPDSYAIELFQSGKSLDACRSAIINKLAASHCHVSGVNGVGRGEDEIEKKRNAMTSAILNRIDPARYQLEKGANEYRGMQLHEVAKELMKARGYSVKGITKSEVCDKVFTRHHSTSDFPALMSGVINRILLDPYQSAPEFWDKVARRITASDFREQKLLRFNNTIGMRKTVEGAEIKYDTLAESDQSLKVESYANGVIFTRQAFINDDLSAFDLIPTSFARDWQRLRGDVVWGIITANANMSDGKKLFSTDHSNLLTGGDSALTEVALGKAKTLMTRQKDGANRSLRLTPRFLVVPPELEVAARKLVTETTPASAEGVNVFANKFDVIVEPRLTDASAWYLLADPLDNASLVYAYLLDNETLRVNQDFNFNTDSMEYAVRGEFGASAVDYRGMVKADGK